MREPRCSLVSPKMEETTVYQRREVSNFSRRSGMGWNSSRGIRGDTSRWNMAELERPVESKYPRPISGDSEMAGEIRRESDKAIVVRMPRTNNLGRAKGLDLSDVPSKRKGLGDWR